MGIGVWTVFKTSTEVITGKNRLVANDNTGIHEYLKKGRQGKETLTSVYYSLKQI